MIPKGRPEIEIEGPGLSDFIEIILHVYWTKKIVKPFVEGLPIQNTHESVPGAKGKLPVSHCFEWQPPRLLYGRTI